MYTERIKKTLNDISDAVINGMVIIRDIVKSKGGFLDTQNTNEKNDDIYGVYFHEGDGVQKEVIVKAIKLSKDGSVNVFCGFTELGETEFTEEEMNERFEDRDKEDDYGFWDLLFGGNIWALPTVQSILEAIEEYAYRKHFD